MFESVSPIFCPNIKCRPKNGIIKDGMTVKKGKALGFELQLTEENYSGCDVDIVECPNCLKHYEVSYKIDKIKEYK